MNIAYTNNNFNKIPMPNDSAAVRKPVMTSMITCCFVSTVDITIIKANSAKPA